MAKDYSYRELEHYQRRLKLLEALRKKYQPHPKQQLILDKIKQGKLRIMARAGRQSGKTQECCDVAWMTAGLGRNKVCSIITRERKQGFKIYWKKGTIQNFGPRSWVEKVSKDDMTVYFKNGSYIEIDGSDNKDAHRGDKKDLCILDEFKDIDPDFYFEIIEPMFATNPDGIVIIIGTPPATPESHFKDMEDLGNWDRDWETSAQ